LLYWVTLIQIRGRQMRGLFKSPIPASAFKDAIQYREC